MNLVSQPVGSAAKLSIFETPGSLPAAKSKCQTGLECYLFNARVIIDQAFPESTCHVDRPNSKTRCDPCAETH
jgi:hypothetical protein